MHNYLPIDKTEISDIFSKHVLRVERSLKLKVKAIRTNNGSKFINENFKRFYETYGIKQKRSNPYTLTQNNAAE